MEIKNLIEISISEEHYKNLEEVKSCFDYSEEFDVKANYMRKSMGDLPMQIIVHLQNIPLKDLVNWGVEGFVGGSAALAGKETYSLLKSGIKKIYQKFKDCSLTIVCGERWYQLSKNGKIKLTHPFDKSFEFGEKTVDEFFDYIVPINLNDDNEWKECLLEEVVEKFIDYRGKTPKKTSSGIPLITAKIVKDGRILTPTEFIAPEDYDSWMTRGLPQVDDVILTTEAPLGEIALLKDKNVALAQRIIAMRCKSDVAVGSFLKYYFQDGVGKKELESRSSGTTVFGIKASVLKKTPVFLPPLEEQKAIAEVLSSLDDKIDLLHRQNQTLEKLAETLFEQWISERELDASISQLIRIQNGYAFKSSEFKESGNYGVLKIKNISSGVVDINKTDFVIYSLKADANERFLVKSGDVLIGMTGAEIGKLGLVPQTEKTLYLNQRVGLLKEKTEGAKYLAYLHLKSEFGQDYIENTATGSAQPNISGEGIENCPFPLLSTDKIEEYSKTILPLYQKLVFNLGQIQSLEKTRDQLLPNLMSGEMKVEELKNG